MMKKWREEKAKKKSLKLGGVLLAFVVAFSAMIGFLNVGSTMALDGDYWTMTNDDGLSITVVSVVQNGLSLTPQEDGEGGYYFDVANNTDTVTVGMIVDGMKPGETYYYSETENYFSSRRELTSENNGDVIYEGMRPYVYFQDEDDCHGDCWVDPMSGKYYVDPGVEMNNGIGVRKYIIVHPATIGSQNVEIVSVKQNDVDLTLADNEYQITDYDAPVTVTIRLKNLEIGKNYSLEVSDEYEQFKAEASERTVTRELRLNYIDRHIRANVRFFDSYNYNEDNNVTLRFKVTDEDFKPLGTIIVDSISQNNEQIEPEENTSDSSRDYSFRVNDVQPISISFHSIQATPEMTYYITYSLGGNSSREPFAVSGEDLENGAAVLVIPAGYGLSEDSPVSLYFYVDTVGANGYHESPIVYYQDFGPSSWNSDYFYIDYFEDPELPRYDARMGYTVNGEEVDDVIINAKYHDEDNPLWVRIEGERYDDEITYDVHAKVTTVNGEYYSETFAATGAELNEGKTFVLDGLVLNLPEFDPNEEFSGYETYYDFSLEINGLELSGTMYYRYDGYIYTVMTYAGGRVAAAEGVDGIGGLMYITSSSMSVNRSSLDGSKNAVLHFRGGGFDEDLSYNYAVYYNDGTGDGQFSESAGEKIEEGVLPGSWLNNDEISVSVAVPSNASEGAMYSLVITRNNGVVLIARNYLTFTDDPRLESFTFHADDDSFMQTGAQDYRLARGADATATLTGVGFDENSEYRIWTFYSGYYFEHNDEYDYDDYRSVDLEELDESIVVTGAQLNAGYDYALEYNEAMDEAENVNVVFKLTDRDSEKPNMYGEAGEGVYSGHAIGIEYVYEEDVFNADEGFQIDTETGEIIDVAQPDDHHGGDDMVDNRTHNNAETSVEDGTLTLTAAKPCVVIGVNGNQLTVIEAGAGSVHDGVTTNLYDVNGYEGVVVAVKGDGDFDGEVSSADSNLINRSLISQTLRPYRDLSDLERVVLDVDGDGEVSSGDSNLINRSLISSSLRPYKPLEW